MVAPGVGAADYRTQVPAGEATLGPYGAAAARALAKVNQERSAPIAPDPRLAKLADWIAQTPTNDLSAPPYPVIDLYARQLGLPEPTADLVPQLLLLTGSDAAMLERQIITEVQSLLHERQYTHFGVATLARRDEILSVLVLSFRQLTLQPVPRHLARDAALRLRGTLLAPLHNAQVIVTYPDGTTYRGKPQAGMRIHADVQTRGRGEQRIELVADSPAGTQVVANFPVYVGVPPAREVHIETTSHDKPLDASQLAQRLLQLINTARVQTQLKPLARNNQLDEIALAHSEDMFRHHFVAHTSPTTGTALDRVTRAGVRTPLVLENIGRGYSAQQIHRSLMDSPGHRQNILNPDATHVGIGVVLVPEPDRPAYLVTELFARFAEPVDLEHAASQLVAAISRGRATRGLTPLKHDETLSQLCGYAAQSFFRDTTLTKEQVIEQLNREAAATRPGYTQLVAVAAVTTSVDGAAKLDAWFDPKARALGLGLAQGTRADTFENAIIVVALLGY